MPRHARAHGVLDITDDLLKAHIEFNLSLRRRDDLQIEGSSMGLAATGFTRDDVLQSLIEQAQATRAQAFASAPSSRKAD